MISGGEMARNYLDIFGKNIDAVLDIGQPCVRLAGMVKGFTEPADCFSQYGGHDILGSHRETGRYHVSILDDHDMVGRDKRRFAAGIPRRFALCRRPMRSGRSSPPWAFPAFTTARSRLSTALRKGMITVSSRL
ncbi:MAG: hypothetical protein IT210_07535 [Armatimonadetes bacterium]|nr:hypothetical protein [Armatimonadota bacterium]